MGGRGLWGDPTGPPLPLPSPSPGGLWGQSSELGSRGPCSRSVYPWAGPFLPGLHFPICHMALETDGTFGCLILVSPSACLSDHPILPSRVPKEMWVLPESKASLGRR